MAINLSKPLYVVCNPFGVGCADYSFPLPRNIAKKVMRMAGKPRIRQYVPKPLNWGIDQDPGY